MLTKIRLNILAGLLVLFSVVAKGQSFTELTSNNYGVYNGDLALADLDRNDTLELILVGTDSVGLDVLRIYNLDTNGNLFIVKQIDIPSIKKPIIQVSDINNNGFIDVLITGSVDEKPYFNIFINRSNFEFEDYSLQLPQLNGGLLLSDFTNNGSTDFIASNKQVDAVDTHEFYFNKNGLFSLCDTCTVLPLKNMRLLDIDLANNGFTDFILSGLDDNDVQKFYLYENRNNEKFDTTELPFEEIQNPRFTKGDFTQNGFMDVVVAGKINGKDSLLIYKNSPSGFEFEIGLALEDSIAKMLPADFTNDGLLDLLVLTEEQLILYYNDGTNGYDTTIITSLITQSSIAIGDFDRDNDQDIFVTGLKGVENSFQLFKNEYTTNKTPNNPDSLYAFTQGDSVTLMWNNGTDDTTLPTSLTYNVFVKGVDGSVMPVHSGKHRSLSGYGLQSLSNQLVIKDLKEGTYEWAVQPIDNSLIGPVCLGPGARRWIFEINDNVEITYNVCKGDTIKIALSPPIPVQWFSNDQGELSLSDTLIYIASNNDVVYSNYFNEDGNIETFTAYVKVLSNEDIDITNQVVCQGETISFDISELFIEALWYFKSQGDTIKGTTVELIPLQSDSLVVTAIAENGCSISKTVFVQVNELPEIYAGDDVTIFKGESVNLIATGGDTYLWSPPTGLNNVQISNPLANPKETITYTVIGSGTDNCINKDDVVVFVKQSVFVPNLFSPNADGRNDSFKVYGTNLKSVVLKIYDTQGKLLFESANISAVMNTGWDGTYNGGLMPQGNYLWVISGDFQDGSRVTSNGKVTGSVTLIR